MLRISFLMLLLCLCIACTSQTSETRDTEIQIRKTERQITIPFQGRTLDNSNFHIDHTVGFPTLLVFWAPW